MQCSPGLLKLRNPTLCLTDLKVHGPEIHTADDDEFFPSVYTLLNPPPAFFCLLSFLNYFTLFKQHSTLFQFSQMLIPSTHDDPYLD